MSSDSILLCDRVWRNARLATMAAAGVIEDGLIACRDGKIVFAGSTFDAPQMEDAEAIDCGGRWITPGLIDCHNAPGPRW